MCWKFVNTSTHSSFFNPLKAKSISLSLQFCYSFCLQQFRCPSFSQCSSSCKINNVSQAIPMLCLHVRINLSLHFLPTSELLRTLRITLIFHGNAPQILGASKHVHHSRLLCECHVVIGLSVLTVFVSVH